MLSITSDLESHEQKQLEFYHLQSTSRIISVRHPMKLMN